MSICVFGKYKVHFKNLYSYISDKAFGETFYEQETAEWEKMVDGSTLLHFISREISDVETIDVTSEDNSVQITQFNPCNGTGSDIYIKWEEIK